MVISKIKAAWALLTGGIAGGIKYLLDVFNTQILGEIPNKEAGVKYLKDIQAASACIKAISDNHAEDMTEKQRDAIKNILSAIEELAKALEDFKISEDELDAIIARVQEAIDTFKRSK